MKRVSIKDLLVLAVATNVTRVFVWSTRFGKQTYAKRAIRTLWKASH
jgi:hypothetical protein